MMRPVSDCRLLAATMLLVFVALLLQSARAQGDVESWPVGARPLVEGEEWGEWDRGAVAAFSDGTVRVCARAGGCSALWEDWTAIPGTGFYAVVGVGGGGGEPAELADFYAAMPVLASFMIFGLGFAIGNAVLR